MHVVVLEREATMCWGWTTHQSLLPNNPSQLETHIHKQNKKYSRSKASESPLQHLEPSQDYGWDVGEGPTPAQQPQTRLWLRCLRQPTPSQCQQHKKWLMRKMNLQPYKLHNWSMTYALTNAHAHRQSKSFQHITKQDAIDNFHSPYHHPCCFGQLLLMVLHVVSASRQLHVCTPQAQDNSSRLKTARAQCRRLHQATNRLWLSLLAQCCSWRITNKVASSTRQCHTKTT